MPPTKTLELISKLPPLTILTSPLSSFAPPPSLPTTAPYSSSSFENPNKRPSSPVGTFPLPSKTNTFDSFNGNPHAFTSKIRPNFRDFHQDDPREENEDGKPKRAAVEENPAVKEVLKLINFGSRWNPKLENRLRNLLKILKPEHICKVLSSQKDERLSLQFFHWADRQWPYRHDTSAYYTILKQLSRTKLCQEAKKIITLMKARGIRCGPEAFTYLMLCYSRADHLKKTMQVLTLMQRSGISPDLTACNTAIHALILQNRLEKALKFLDRMQKVGIYANIVTYNCLIKGYCKTSMVDDALKLLDEMPCCPDRVSYCTIMAFFCKEKRVKELKELLQRMTEKSGIMVDQGTYISLVHMFSKHGHGDEALGFLREAEGQGFVVDRIGHTAVVDAYCRSGELDKAKQLVSEMARKGHPPDVVTYTSVVNGMCLAGDVDRAKKMLRGMYERGHAPNVFSYTAVLAGLSRGGRTAEARAAAAASGGWWTPNSVTYSVLLHGFLREGNPVGALEVAREMMAKGFHPTPVEINSLVRALRPEEAKGFLAECRREGCHVNVVNYTTAICGFCRGGDVAAALSLMDDMYLCGKHPDVYTYTAVVGALAKAGRTAEAGDMTAEMVRRGVAPTPTTYRIIIHRYCERGAVDDLLGLLEKMLPRHPYRAAYNHLVEKLCRFGNLRRARRLLPKVLTRGGSPRDLATCNSVLEKCFEEGMHEEAYEVARKMFRRNMVPDVRVCEKVRDKLAAGGAHQQAEKLVMWFVERGVGSPPPTP